MVEPGPNLGGLPLKEPALPLVLVKRQRLVGRSITRDNSHPMSGHKEHNPLGISAQLMMGTGPEGQRDLGPSGHGDLLRKRQRETHTQ